MREDHNIKVSFKRRGSRRKRKRKRRGRKRYKRSGLVFKFVTHDKNGKKHNHYVTASSLGRVQDSEATFTSPKDYTLNGIDKKLDENKERAKQARANQRKAEKEAHEKAVQRKQNQQQQEKLWKQRKDLLENEKIRKAKQRKHRSIIQRKRNQRIIKVQQAVKKSSTVVDNAIKERQRHQRQFKVDRKISEEPFKRLSTKFGRVESRIKGLGSVQKIVRNVVPKLSKLWKDVKQRTSRVHAWFKHFTHPKTRKKTVRLDDKKQHWYTNENGAIERTGDHLELYLQHAMAFKNHKDNKVFVLATPYYRRDISKYYGGQPVYSMYSPRFKKYYHGQLLTLGNFNRIMRFSNQPTFSERKLSDYLNSHSGLVLINGDRTQIQPAPFKAPVYRYRGSYIFNQSKVAPTSTPFSYANELKLNRKWHWEHDFNMSHNRYWNWYSNMYQYDRGVQPNPKDTKLLHDFQFQIEYAIRSGQKKRNEPLTPCNQIERGIDESVNADPDDANNYTQPWYVHGTDKQPSDDGRGFE